MPQTYLIDNPERNKLRQDIIDESYGRIKTHEKLTSQTRYSSDVAREEPVKLLEESGDLKRRGWVPTEIKGLDRQGNRSTPISMGGSDDVRIGRSLNQTDRLIAEGKIRVVSRNGRDVYQIKKGKENGAIESLKGSEKPAIPEIVTNEVPVSKKDQLINEVVKKIPQIKIANKEVKLPEEITKRQLELEMTREQLNQDNLSQFTQYVAHSGEFKGKLPEVFGKSESSQGRSWTSENCSR